MQLLLASSNQGKITEFAEYFQKLGIQPISQATLGIDDAIENGIGFVDNALIKARHAAMHTDLPVLADDSGLIVDALNGEPGLLSARYAGEHGNFNANIDKVIEGLQAQGLSASPARFYCCLVLLQKGPQDQMPLVFDGIWEGTVVTERSGDGGFGYDPIFIDPQTGLSAAAMFEQKKTCSHRAQALAKLMQYLAVQVAQ